MLYNWHPNIKWIVLLVLYYRKACIKCKVTFVLYNRQVCIKCMVWLLGYNKQTRIKSILWLVLYNRQARINCSVWLVLFIIYIQIYSRKGCERVDVGCVWEVIWRREQTATHWPNVLLTIAALLPHSAGLLNRGSWGPKTSVWSWFSLRQLISNWNCDSNYNSNWLKFSVAPGYLTSTCLLWAYSSAPN